MEKKHTVLIVDDESDFVEVLKQILEKENFIVASAYDREEAERMVRAHEPGVIILGTIMPRGDAFLFHKWMKQTLGFGNLPIMVINAPPEKQLLKGWRMDEGMQMDAEDFLAKTVDLIPDVVVMDIVMPVMNGLDAAREICKKCKSAKVLMLTQYDDEENVLASKKVGAVGFIPKAAASSRLLTGIRSVARGDQSWIEALQPHNQGQR